jgi:peptide methionine sulfoxide reductase MsrB
MKNISYSRHFTATNESQLSSLAEEKQCVRYCRYSYLTLKDRQSYFDVSCTPITKKAEDEMEMLSDLITIGELYTKHFKPGKYICARCHNSLFSSNDKWNGPCVWPSFRKGINESSLKMPEVLNYNDYECLVNEVYCKSCYLFIGHRFEDGKKKGDTHPEARWRF